jgi:hypothetical protein
MDIIILLLLLYYANTDVFSVMSLKACDWSSTVGKREGIRNNAACGIDSNAAAMKCA